MNDSPRPGMGRRTLIRAGLGGVAGLSIPAAGAAACGVSARSTVSDELLHGRAAYVLQNSHMRLAVLRGGGFIGELTRTSAGCARGHNLMRVPHYPTIDPFDYSVELHGALYGDGMQRRLMSGYMGHFLCFPHFGPSSPAEFKQDYAQHGEALAVPWERQPAQRPDELLTIAELPITQYRIERSIVMPSDESVAYVTETVENLARYDRPVQRVQHLTYGPPFVSVGRNFAEGSIQNVVTGTASNSELTTWPIGQDPTDGPTDFRSFSGKSRTWQMDRSGPTVYVAVHNPDLGILVGYIFDATFNGWALDWQQNLQNTAVPWNGKAIARGICIGDSAIGGLRNAVRLGALNGTPTYSWIGARERSTQRYAIFLADISSEFRGVESISARNGTISVRERETGRLIVISAALL